MTRLAVDGADIYIVEHGCATNIKVHICLFLGQCNPFSFNQTKPLFLEVNHIFIVCHHRILQNSRRELSIFSPVFFSSLIFFQGILLLPFSFTEFL